MGKALVTGSAGFIGYHLAQLMLEKGWEVAGIDGITDYYDPDPKRRRHQQLQKHGGFTAHEFMLEDMDRLMEVGREFKPGVIVHLAAQAGVRYSIDNPRSYVDSNLTGGFNVLELARELDVGHLLMASTSSVYGANTDMPFDESQATRHPMSFYAATKQANEAMAHAYAHLHGIPTTMFRFFTVYGPWGRPDMALFKFTRAMLAGEPIDVYNHGKMRRDFTYVADLVEGVSLLVDVVPPRPGDGAKPVKGDSLSPVAPWRLVNIGTGRTVGLMDYIHALEEALGVTAEKNMLEMQPGDVPATHASNDLLVQLTGFEPSTGLKDGIAAFVDWFRRHYNK